MEEIKSILIIWSFAYVIEYFKSEMDLSMFNVLTYPVFRRESDVEILVAISCVRLSNIHKHKRSDTVAV